MLLSLHIKNIALISELSLEFGPGLNILSGETGAGKSIIIDSLNFVLGDRADRGLIRHGESTASVQAVFSVHNPGLSQLLLENGIQEEDTIIVRRTMNENGRGDCRVNGVLVNLSFLKNMMSLLVDIHSQHENQALLNESNHIRILDNFSHRTSILKEKYRQSFAELKEAERELSAFPDAAERDRKIDILEFQLDEIKKANLREGEEESLIKERAKFYNSQKVLNGLSAAVALLDGDNGGFGANPSLHSAIKELNAIASYDDSYADLSGRLESAKIELADISDTLKRELENSAFDPSKMETIEKRIEEIRKLKRRFGSTVEEIETYAEKASSELAVLRSAAERIGMLKEKIEIQKSIAVKLAKELHAVRSEDAAAFSAAIIKNLTDLGMAESTFAVDFDYPAEDETFSSHLHENGADAVRFMISPNKGEPLRPLSKIASGGEMSRFMLGLKNITAELEDIDTLVFDEIDSGISGRIAKVVACKLYNIAKTRQVLAVTHLPQLASMADTHYLIEKNVIGGKTLTSVEALDEEASLKEIMRLAGSIEKSESGLENAKEMKKWADAYKKSQKLS
jgi:DNA repair protein RecN (Recombination protein N)